MQTACEFLFLKRRQKMAFAIIEQYFFYAASSVQSALFSELVPIYAMSLFCLLLSLSFGRIRKNDFPSSLSFLIASTLTQRLELNVTYFYSF